MTGHSGKRLILSAIIYPKPTPEPAALHEDKNSRITFQFVNSFSVPWLQPGPELTDPYHKQNMARVIRTILIPPLFCILKEQQ